MRNPPMDIGPLRGTPHGGTCRRWRIWDARAPQMRQPWTLLAPLTAIRPWGRGFVMSCLFLLGASCT